MAIVRLNHAVLYVSDLARSLDFYVGALGFRPIEAMGTMTGAAFLQAAGSTNDHDLGLFEIGGAPAPSHPGRATVGLYHLAWEVDTLAELERLGQVLTARGALVGASDHGTTKSLYARDPDGIELEIAWLIPADLIPADVERGVTRLDLAAEQARYGADTRGGVGVSVS